MPRTRQWDCEASEVNPETFQAYLQTLYIGKVVAANDTDVTAFGNRAQSRVVQKKAHAYLPKLVNLAISNKLIDCTFANAIIAILLMMDKVAISPGAGYVSRVYEKLPRTSKLRSLCYDAFLANVSKEHDFELPTELPSDSFVDITFRAKQVLNEDESMPNPAYARCYEYHEHSADMPKSAKCV